MTGHNPIVIIGVGLNISVPIDVLSAGINALEDNNNYKWPPGSLHSLLGISVTPAAIKTVAVKRFMDHVKDWMSGDLIGLLDMISRRQYLYNTVVSFRAGDVGTIEGMHMGLNHDGAIIIRDVAKGEDAAYYSGEILV